jgi:hypothetical protein
MGHCARKLHSLAAARTSHVLAVLTHSIVPDTQSRGPSRTGLSRPRSVSKICPIGGEPELRELRFTGPICELTRNGACYPSEVGWRRGDQIGVMLVDL